ncbi:hypothetical protein [Falsiroseomonas sp.]|uniref:hypothetical protein n=1 Tax=Falsiroseomonas sp. TaxID=2870721 RepID=UPI003562E6E2
MFAADTHAVSLIPCRTIEKLAREVAKRGAGDGQVGGDAFTVSEARRIVGHACLRQPRRDNHPGAAVPAHLRERDDIEHHQPDEGREEGSCAADALRQPVRLEPVHRNAFLRFRRELVRRRLNRALFE